MRVGMNEGDGALRFWTVAIALMSAYQQSRYGIFCDAVCCWLFATILAFERAGRRPAAVLKTAYGLVIGEIRINSYKMRLHIYVFSR